MAVDPEARYRALFETTLDGILIVDDSGQYVDVNESMCRLLKAPRERLIGAHFSEFIPAELLESATLDFNDLKAWGRFEGEFPLRAVDGSRVEIDWRSRAHFVPGLHFCVARDINVRKRAEEQLRRKQAELTDFVENATVGLHWVGPDGTILWANRAELDLLGYRREEYVGHSIAEFHADSDAIQDILQRLSAKEELHNYEARLRCKDGSLRQVLISSNVLWEEDQFIHTRCFTRDITERKQAEARNATLLETSLDAIVTIDAKGTMLEFSPAAEQIFGYRRTEMLGQPMAEFLIPPALRERHYEGLARYLATGEGPVLDQRLELTALRAGGAEFPIELAISRVPTAGPPLFTAYIRDITERRRAERRLAAEHAVARILTDAATLDEAAPRILEALCRSIEGEVGILWEIDARGEALRCTAFWSGATSPELERFQAMSRSLTFARGVGVPGRVWGTGATTAVRELDHDSNFPRLPLARAVGLHGAVAFPILTGDEFFGVVEFFTGRSFEPDAALMPMMTAIGQDLAQFIRRRRAEAALFAERERLRVTLGSIGDAVIVTDAAGRPTFLNPVAEALTGWRQEEAAAKTLEEVFHIVNEETRETVESPVLRVLREGVVVGLANHTLLITREGAERPIDDSAAPIRDDQGDIDGVVLVFRDVSERREAERAVRQGQQRLQMMIESVRDYALFSLDLQGRVISWNSGAERLFGYTEAEIVGRSARVLFTPEDQAAGAPEQEMETAATDGQAADERWHQRKDESRFFVSGIVTPMRDATGQLVGFTKVARDITERRQAEDALLEADRRKDEFLAMLAHELRNPLAPIRNALHLLRLQPDDTVAVERWRSMMDRQVSHLTRLVDDLLDVSRINRGKISLQRAPLDLARLIRHTVEDQRPALEEAGLAIEIDLPEAAVWTVGDATRLTQVLDNLLENARKFTDRGGRVTVQLSVEAADDQAVMIVRDTGIGIEPELLQSLFDVFAQADRSLDRSRGGLGLGLALVKGMVGLHGGSVEARSAGIKQGAEFVIRLPLQPAPAALAELPAPSGTIAAGLDVLIVEDNQDAAESLKDLLESHGYQVRVARTGPDGLDLARQTRPDVVICDIGLPGMDGFAVATALRQEADLSRTRLIALTGYGQEEDARRCREAGFDEHLVKPVDLDQLLARLPPVL